MWLSLHLSPEDSLEDKTLLIDDLYSPSSSLYLRLVVFARLHHHATHTGDGCCHPEPGWKADFESADKLPSLIKTSAFLAKQLSSFSIKALHWAKAKWERAGWEYLTLWVSPVDMHHCSWREKRHLSKFSGRQTTKIRPLKENTIFHSTIWWKTQGMVQCQLHINMDAIYHLWMHATT